MRVKAHTRKMGTKYVKSHKRNLKKSSACAGCDKKSCMCKKCKCGKYPCACGDKSATKTASAVLAHFGIIKEASKAKLIAALKAGKLKGSQKAYAEAVARAQNTRKGVAVGQDDLAAIRKARAARRTADSGASRVMTAERTGSTAKPLEMRGSRKRSFSGPTAREKQVTRMKGLRSGAVKPETAYEQSVARQAAEKAWEARKTQVAANRAAQTARAKPMVGDLNIPGAGDLARGAAGSAVSGATRVGGVVTGAAKKIGDAVTSGGRKIKDAVGNWRARRAAKKTPTPQQQPTPPQQPKPTPPAPTEAAKDVAEETAKKKGKSFDWKTPLTATAVGAGGVGLGVGGYYLGRSASGGNRPQSPPRPLQQQ